MASRRAFSLVELSIVLVILGLLVGGVLSGQALIHSAELRAATKEQGEILTALNTFRDKYFALPGDMNNATSFFLREKIFLTNGVPAQCISNTGAGWSASDYTGTCDGDGNGRIEPMSTLGAAEDAQFWQHLSMAGLLQGASMTQPGVNFGATVSHPASRFPTGYWSALFVPPASGLTEAMDDWSGVSLYNTPQNLLTIGATLGNVQAAHAQLFTTQDAWNLDAKADDGMPYTGKWRAPWDDKYIAGIDPCTTGVTTASTYRLASTTKACGLAILGML